MKDINIACSSFTYRSKYCWMQVYKVDKDCFC